MGEKKQMCGPCLNDVLHKSIMPVMRRTLVQVSVFLQKISNKPCKSATTDKNTLIFNANMPNFHWTLNISEWRK